MMTSPLKLILFVILIPCFCFSQNHIKKLTKRDVGFEGGVSFSDFRESSSTKNITGKTYSKKSGLNFGINYNLSFKKKFYFSSAVLFERKVAGIEYSQTYLNSPFNCDPDLIARSLSLNYLSIPLNVTFQTLGKVKFFVGLGFQYSYLLSSNFKNLSGTVLSSRTAFNNSDIGILSALGINYALNVKWSLAFRIKNNFGLQNITKRTNELNLKTNTLYSNFGLTFNL